MTSMACPGASQDLCVACYDRIMPIDRKPNETREEFMSRCIPMEIKAGKERDQAIAICASKYSEKSAHHYEDKKKKKRKKS